MADPPRYEQVLDTSLFVMARGPADVGWAAYLVAEGDKPPQKPISVADGLQVYNGHFLFALTPPALTTAPEVAHFVSAVYDWLNQSFGPPQPTFGGSALVWIPDAATPAFGNPSSYAFTIQAVSTTSWTLASDFNNTIGRRLTASMPNGTGIAVGANGGSLVFTGSGVNLGTTDPGHAPTVDPARAELPVLGPYSGCLLLRGALTPAATFAYFETGVRYSHPSDSGVKSQTYPVVSSASQKPILY
ncbi:MAG: hypothetical protein QOK04_1077, partial [Solirubrobacteraceae bacterium]|nr:hypothetical protein [Solirubrobacteraceae bacterium]